MIDTTHTPLGPPLRTLGPCRRFYNFPIMVRRAELLREQTALLIEHDALLLEHEQLTASGCTQTAWRTHADKLLNHRLRLRSFIEALQAWMSSRRKQ